MTDAAGFVVGLPGLISSCANVYQLVVNARRLNTEGSLIVVKLAVEQVKFHIWLGKAGLLRGSVSSLNLHPVAQKVLQGILEGVKVTLVDLGGIIDRYELSEGGSVNSVSFALPDKFWDIHSSPVDHDKSPDKPSSRPRRRRSSLLQRTQSSLKAVTWASADQQRARELLTDLRGFNDDLGLVTREFGAADFSSLPSHVLPRVLDDVNLKRIFEAAADTEPDLSRCAAFKLEVLAIARQSLDKPDKRSELRKSPRALVERRPLDHHANTTPPPGRRGWWLAKFVVTKGGAAEDVILEDKTYDDVANDEAFVEKRVEDISRLLSRAPRPDSMRILDCAGYFPDHLGRCFSFIFKFPAGADVSTPPVSLHHLMSTRLDHDSNSSGGMLLPILAPSLGERFALARALARALTLLQACGALHKAFGSRNILFFRFPGPGTGTGTDGGHPYHEHYDLQRPYIAGFGYARLHGRDSSSDDYTGSGALPSHVERQLLYAHPEYAFTTQQRYLKVFDLYSLGLLLAEIALWQPLEDIAQHYFPYPSTTTDEGKQQWDQCTRHALRRALFADMSRFCSVVGDKYTRVVARCISGCFDDADGMPRELHESDKADDDRLGSQEGQDGGGDAEFQEMVERNVVRELAGLVV
ncbi:hypothetical protein B0T24DRAFT_630422 [Lasiosphaeria ovina]|uniref:Prion-inhibition and propagation HeLo domain-containing protein n=1 Tax=Lasiosphaeria ovina TaxID=92902 RepID=A0AAE0N682_9PEZI|nr:hypothetical protein B0T24DRAFT_630422 [Lasiosphaeria ovina]